MSDTPALPQKPVKDIALDLLVLAFSRSKLRDVVGTDALRMVVGGSFHEMAAGGTFRLQMLWDIIADQPGFDAESAAPPLCLFKSWENRIGMPVELPSALAHLSVLQRNDLAAMCPVRADEMLEALKAPPPPAATLAPRAAEPEQAAAPIPVDAFGKPQKPSRIPPQAKLAIYAGVSLLCLAVVGITVAKSLKGPAFQQVPADFMPGVAVAKSQRLGNQIIATVGDARWFVAPKPNREEQLKKAIATLRPAGIDTLVVFDEANQPRASVQWVGKAPAPTVRFQ